MKALQIVSKIDQMAEAAMQLLTKQSAEEVHIMGFDIEDVGGADGRARLRIDRPMAWLESADSIVVAPEQERNVAPQNPGVSGAQWR